MTTIPNNGYILKRYTKTELFVICTSYNSILNDIDQLKNEIDINTLEGILIIDQLLVTGNGRNRFLACNFSKGFLDFKSARNIEGRIEYKRITSYLLRQNLGCIKYSILTEKQKVLLEQGLPF